MKCVRTTVFIILALIGLIVWIERADFFSFLDDEEVDGAPRSDVAEQEAS